MTDYKERARRLLARTNCSHSAAKFGVCRDCLEAELRAVVDERDKEWCQAIVEEGVDALCLTGRDIKSATRFIRLWKEDETDQAEQRGFAACQAAAISECEHHRQVKSLKGQSELEFTALVLRKSMEKLKLGDTNPLLRRELGAELDEARRFSTMLCSLPVDGDSISHAAREAGLRISELQRQLDALSLGRKEEK